MRKLIPGLSLLLAACSAPTADSRLLEKKLDSLQIELAAIKNDYRPGLGEIMGGIQQQHSKLWFAGLYGNWPLAAYETDELKERFEQARVLAANRPETKNLPMIFAPLDTLSAVVARKDEKAFTTAFKTLTQTCNNCHGVSNFSFNVISMPGQLPVPNQDFRPRQDSTR